MIIDAPTQLLVENPSCLGYEVVAKDYEKGRPDYPEVAAHHFASVLGIVAGKRVLDLGAGTGKLTKALLDTGATFLGVEPVAEMRNVFKGQLPGCSILEGSAEMIPLEAAQVDCVVVGTAFHWFEGKKALEEIARVLKPRGKLGLIWNIFDADIGWVAKIRSLLGVEHTHDSLEWKNAFEEGTSFGPLLHLTYSYRYPGTAEDVISRVLSAKIMGTLPEQKRKKLVERVIHILNTDPATQGKEIFDIPYRIEIYWTQKL